MTHKPSTPLLLLAITSLIMWPMTALAQQAPLPPPTQSPTGLPPAPANSLPQQLPAQSPPVPGNVDTSNGKTPDVAPEFDLSTYNKGMMAEIDRLDQALASQFRVIGVQQGSNDQTLAISAAEQQRQGGLSPPVQQEIGPGSVLAKGSFGGVGGPELLVCVITLDPERAAMAWENYVAPPVKSGSHPQTGFAWLAGHAVGHCLDIQDRTTQLGRKMAWTLNESSDLGLWPDAVQASLPMGLGNNFSSAAVFSNATRIYENPLQIQFSERASDAFATLWVLRLGASKEGVSSIAKVRKDENIDPAGIMTANTPKFSSRADASSRADRLWGLAREIQIGLGVDPAKKTATKNIGVSGADSVVQWEVTPQGLLGIDKDGKAVVLPNTGQTKGNSNQPSKNFSGLKRFGEP